MCMYTYMYNQETDTIPGIYLERGVTQRFIKLIAYKVPTKFLAMPTFALWYSGHPPVCVIWNGSIMHGRGKAVCKVSTM